MDVQTLGWLLAGGWWRPPLGALRASRRACGFADVQNRRWLAWCPAAVAFLVLETVW